MEPESVSAVTSRIKAGLEQWFRDVWVEGELSNVRLMETSAHAYFTVKDAGAQLSCAFFGAARNPNVVRILRDGAKVRLRGSISVYPPRGSYQLIVRVAEPVGQGELMIRFEELKKALAAEGLFDAAVKRPIPALPRKVGIVTSPTGAAIRDMLNVTRRRFAGMHIVIAPARVQGVGAAEEIVAGIGLLNSLEEKPDVIIVGRGGGSIEDLWCFNEEIVARAVRASKIPVISAVGHEIDFTICDFAADLRAPTPSAAAELVVGNRADMVDRVAGLYGRLSHAAASSLALARSRLNAAVTSRAFARPGSIVREQMQRVDLFSEKISAAFAACRHENARRAENLSARLSLALRNGATNARARYEKLSGKLTALDPRSVLDRGYALVENAEGDVVTSASRLSPGDTMTTVFRDGRVVSTVADKPSV